MKIKVIADFLGAEFDGNGENEISSVASLEAAGQSEIAFVEKPETFIQSGAGCLLIAKGAKILFGGSVIRVQNPKLAFAKIAARLHSVKQFTASINALASVSDDADVASSFIDAFVSVGPRTSIGENTRILAGTRIGADVQIGENSVIHPNCVIYDNVTIGDNSIIHAGAVIGADGFGYVRDGAAGYVKFPQIGRVTIGDDVEIGANTCIDRGALGETRIGNGTKIDNLVQIAHNVQIGERVVIASQTGISGSTVIEDDCVIGGQVGFGDHATVRKGAIIGSQAGVLPGKIVRQGVWWGTPVQPLDEYKRQNAHVKGLGRLKEEVRELKRKIDK